MVNRRKFLFGAGAVILAAPTLSTLRISDLSVPNPLSLTGGPPTGALKPYPVNRTLDHLVGRAHASNPFVAEAADPFADGEIVKVEPMQLLSSTEALQSIFENLGLEWDLKDHVCYCNAKQCDPQFRAHEREMRRQFGAFDGVKRSPKDDDVAYLVAADSTTDPTTTAAATQFGGYDSVGISDDDPGLVLAASSLIHKDYSPSSREVAQTFAVTNKEPWVEGGRRLGTRYETPVLSFYHEWEPRNGTPLGALIVRNNQRHDRVVYYGDLYAEEEEEG
jgi:hypothetical protein